jgi:hypothetical protein
MLKLIADSDLQRRYQRHDLRDSRQAAAEGLFLDPTESAVYHAFRNRTTITAHEVRSVSARWMQSAVFSRSKQNVLACFEHPETHFSHTATS